MLTLRQSVGLNLPPLLLRVVLGVIFVWAGLGKVADRFEVRGEDAALLSRMGVIAAPSAGAGGQGAGGQGAGGAGGEATAADFPEFVSVRGVNRLALLVARAASPPRAEDGSARMALWPASLGQGSWPVRLAWAAAVTELVGGALLLLGLFTRLWGVALAGVMVVAIWLTEIGPAMQSGTTHLGFLPAYDWFNPGAWNRLWLQSCCLVMALSLAALGSGRLGLDHVVLGGKGETDPDDD